MVIYRVEGPDGKVYRIEGPQGATAEQLGAVISAQGSRQARIDEIKRSNPAEYDTSSPEYQEKYGPTSGMSTAQRLVAGYGAAVPRLARGIGQTLGLVSQQEVDERNRLDAPLLATGAGAAGNIAGNIAAALPTAAIPGAATIPGAAAIGGAQGFLAPSSSDESVLKNTLLGAGAGAGGVLLGRGLNALYQGARALVEPFTQRGRDAIGGRVLQQFGVGAQDVAGASGAPTVTGARPMLAEVIQDPAAAAGAARLQGAMRSVDPQTGAAFAAREVENNAARVGALERIAGTRDAAVAARQASAGPAYQRAFSSGAAQALPEDLARSPAIQRAINAARTNAANAGEVLDPSNLSVESLHNVKLALDDMISRARGGNGSPAQRAQAEGLEAAQRRLVAFMESASPEYAGARAGYAAASRPVNQADIAAELLRAGSSRTSDLAGNARLMPNSLLSAISDEGALMRRATGRDLGDDLGRVMEPQQLNSIRGVANEVDRAAAVARAENGPGSATAQRLASQNVLRQVIGPTGLPESWAESTLLNTLMRPVQFGYNQVAEPRIQQVIADALLDPSRAAALLQAAHRGQIRIPDNTAAQLAATAARLAPSSAVANRPQ